MTEHVVGQVVRRYLPRSETFTYTQLRSLRAYAPLVFTLGRENAAEFPGPEVVELTRSSFASRLAGHARARVAGARTTFEHDLARAATDRGCSLLHAHFGWMGAAAVHARRVTGLPLVTTFHANDIVAERADLRAGYARLFADGDLFTAVGPSMAEALADRGCPPERIRLVKLGIDTGAIPFAVPERSEPLVLLQVGRLIEKKAVDVSLRAFARARPTLGPSELWIVGEGPERSALDALAAELGVAGEVRFLGALGHEETLRAMQRADLGLQPSRTARDGDIEGTPTVILELQAAGRPVVATDHSDIPAIVPPGTRLAPEDDAEALAGLLVDTATLPEADWVARCRAGRAFVEAEHGLPAARAVIEDVYAEALA